MDELMELRRLRAGLLVGGLLLTMLAFHLGGLSPHVYILATIHFVGAAALVIGSQTPSYSSRPWRAVAAIAEWLGVRPIQLSFLLFGLSLSLASRAAGGDGPLVHSPLANILWLSGILFTVAGCWKRDGPITTKAWQRWEIIAVVTLFLIGLWLRAWGAADHPYVLSGDEGSAGLVGWEFVSGERDNLIALGWFSFPSLYFFMVSIFQSLFGPNVEAIRWVSALGGALTIPALYWLTRQIFGRRVAIWSTLWLTAFHHHLFFSRVAYNNIWDGFFLVLAAATLWAGWSQSRRGFLLLAGLALGLGQFFYTTSHFVPVLLGVWLIFFLIRSNPPNGERVAGLVCLLLVAVAAFLPLGLLYAQHLESLTYTASRVSILVPGWTEEAAAALGMTPLGLVLEQIWVTFLGLTVAELQGVYYGSGVPLLFGLSVPLFYAGLILCIFRFRKPGYSLPILTLLTTLLVGGLSIQAPNAQRMLLLPPMVALILSLPLEWVYRRASDLWPRGRQVIIILLFGLIATAAFQNGYFFFGDYLPNEEYGSLNGEVTQRMIEILKEEPNDVEVYFVGGERMEFNSIPSLPYLLPGIEASNLEPPYSLPTTRGLSGTRGLVFILPNEVEALDKIERFDPVGTTIPRYNRHGRLLFYQRILGE